MHKVDRQEMNVEKLCRSEISQIMKTVMEFVSVVSSIYHCFLLLDLPLVMSDAVPV